MNTGVYQILNVINGKKYVGSSSASINSRRNAHFSNLKKGTHENKILQRSVDKYGINNFQFSILGFYPSELCIKKEQWFIDVIKPEYNICKIAGSCKGRVLSQETKNKISKKAIGRVISEDTRMKLSISSTGRPCPLKGKNHSKESREKMSLSRKGVPSKRKGIACSDETRKKMSDNRKGKPVPTYFSEASRLALLGKKHSAERIKKSSETHSKHEYKLQLPNGEIITIRNMFKYCKENKLGQTSILATLRGYYANGFKCNYYKGYKLLSKTPIQEQQLQTA